MKQLNTITLIFLTTLCLILLVDKARTLEIRTQNEGVQIIWNDDTESIPCEGQFVKVEMILGNEVYLSPN
jgi:hypothetical protein